jgi:hypothetical protein
MGSPLNNYSLLEEEKIEGDPRIKTAAESNMGP